MIRSVEALDARQIVWRPLALLEFRVAHRLEDGHRIRDTSNATCARTLVACFKVYFRQALTWYIRWSACEEERVLSFLATYF